MDAPTTLKNACQECHRQFVENPTRDPIADESRELIDKLLQERLALAGIARVTGVCERWLQMYLHQKYYQTPRQVEVSQKKEGSSLFQWMKCGRLWGPRRTRNGWG